MRKSIFLLFVILLSLPGLCGFAQTINTQMTPDASVNYDRLSRIDGLIQGYIDKGWLNGMVVLVVKDNQVIKYKGYGYADKEAKTPMGLDELFRLASQTKSHCECGHFDPLGGGEVLS